MSVLSYIVMQLFNNDNVKCLFCHIAHQRSQTHVMRLPSLRWSFRLLSPRSGLRYFRHGFNRLLDYWLRLRFWLKGLGFGWCGLLRLSQVCVVEKSVYVITKSFDRFVVRGISLDWRPILIYQELLEVPRDVVVSDGREVVASRVSHNVLGALTVVLQKLEDWVSVGAVGVVFLREFVERLEAAARAHVLVGQ